MIRPPLAIIGAAAALAISDIPFEHVLGAVRIGMVDGNYDCRTRPMTRARESDFNIVVAGTEEGIVMVEAGAQQACRRDVVGRHRVRPRLLPQDHRAASTSSMARQANRSANSRRRRSIRSCYDEIAGEVRADLTDALNTAEVRQDRKLSP